MKKKTIITTATALVLTLATATSASAGSTSMDVNGCRIGCASSFVSTAGLGVTTNGNGSITCKVTSTLSYRKNGKLSTIKASDSATASVALKVPTPSGGKPVSFSSRHTATSSGGSGSASTSATY